MKKEQFLKELRNSLKRFQREEVDKVIGFYDEMISEKIEHGKKEEEIINELGEIKTIKKNIQLELLNNRAKTSDASLEKTTSSFFIILLLLFASPALIPVGIVFFAVFFTVIITSAALMISFFATSVALIISLIPSIVYVAPQGAAGVILTVGAILLLAGVFGLLTIFFYMATKEILNALIKVATKITNKLNKKENIK